MNHKNFKTNLLQGGKIEQPFVTIGQTVGFYSVFYFESILKSNLIN